MIALTTALLFSTFPIWLPQLSCPVAEPRSIRTLLVMFYAPVGLLCFPKYISHAHAPFGCGEMNKGNERFALSDAVEGR